MRDGSRKIINITEVQGMEGDIIVLSDIFSFEQQGYENGKVIGRLKPTGIRPKFIGRIEDANIHLPPSIFGVGLRGFKYVFVSRYWRPVVQSTIYFKGRSRSMRQW